MNQPKFVNFIEEYKPPSRLTKSWGCFSMTGAALGSIRWWAHWRRYCFFPLPDMLFDANCLADITEFLSMQTELQKLDQKQRRAAKVEV